MVQILSQRILRQKICSMVLFPTLNLACLFFSNYLFGLVFQPNQADFQHDFARMTDEADSSVALAELRAVGRPFLRTVIISD